MVASDLPVSMIRESMSKERVTRVYCTGIECMVNLHSVGGLPTPTVAT